MFILLMRGGYKVKIKIYFKFIKIEIIEILKFKIYRFYNF